MSLDSVIAACARALPDSVTSDAPLARATTYRLGGPAALLAEPKDLDELVKLAEVLKEEGAGVDVLPLGRGSNMVISDHGFPGLVIRLPGSFAWTRMGETETEVVSGGATSMPQLANWAARRSLAGLEFMIAIPGSLGGGVRMNAGAHGGEVADTLRSVRIFDLDALELREVPATHLEMTYRHTNLTQRDLVVDATFELRPEPADEIKARMESYRKHRAATQPGAFQNAGSVFKNPDGDSAGRLVEAAGLKGFSVGGASVADIHANFFLASDEATAQDVFDLVRAVRRKVKERFDVDLQPEIRFVGEFDDGEVTT